MLVASTKKLAFTGLDVWKLFLVGGLFVACGAGTWRVARKMGVNTPGH
ncbi:MAG: hypothetical protein ACR2KV_17420 [Solirubrobacteraceae bacterium]